MRAGCLLSLFYLENFNRKKKKEEKEENDTDLESAHFSPLPQPPAGLVSSLTWTSTVASSQGSQLHPLLPSIFSPEKPEDACEHLSQVLSLLCLDPSMAPTFFRVRAKVLPKEHRPCTIYLRHEGELPFHLSFQVFPLLTPSSHGSLLAILDYLSIEFKNPLSYFFCSQFTDEETEAHISSRLFLQFRSPLKHRFL